MVLDGRQGGGREDRARFQIGRRTRKAGGRDGGFDRIGVAKDALVLGAGR